MTAGLGKLAGDEVAGGGWAAATALLGGAAKTAVGVAAVAWEAICLCALAKSLVRIWIWLCMDWMICSIPEVGRSSRILYPSSSGDHFFHGAAAEFLDFRRQWAIESAEKSVNRVPLCRFIITGMQAFGEFLGLSRQLNYFF